MVGLTPVDLVSDLGERGPGGVALVASDGHQLWLDRAILDRHVLVAGATGSGKTTILIDLLLQLRDGLGEDDALVIFDTKGDYEDLLYRDGDIVIGRQSRAAMSWNLIEDLLADGEDEFEDNVEEVAAAVFSSSLEKTGQRFFPLAAQQVFSQVLVADHASTPSAITDNAMLRRWWSAPTAERVTRLLGDSRAAAFLTDDPRSQQSQGVLAEATAAVGSVFRGVFAQPGGLSLRRHLRERRGRAIFVHYNLGFGDRLGDAYSLVVDLLLKEAIAGQPRGRVWFVLDELRLLPKLHHLDNAVNFGRGRGLDFVVGIQNVDQLNAAYGEHVARGMLSAFGTLIVMRLGDYETRNYVQQRLGRNRMMLRGPAAVQAAEQRVVEQFETGNVLEDWEFGRLEPPGSAFVSVLGRAPIFMRFRARTRQ
ncbi:MAG: type IV secretion system DNA-binding domain-containing protein [Actinomycetota bacterium]|nr:type IV secretion system DNA-binding domain-containing protein [Actinomycetota bacterium]